MTTCTPGTAVTTHRNVITVKSASGGKEETFWTPGNGMDEYAMLGYMERDWNTAYMNRDQGWFEKNYASDYSGVSSGSGKMFTKAEDLADFKNDKTVVASAELSEINVRNEGNAAIVTGVNHVKGRDDKAQPFDYKVRFTDALIRRDGSWQVWATQGTRTP